MKTTPQKAQTEPVQNLLWAEAKGSHPHNYNLQLVL